MTEKKALDALEHTDFQPLLNSKFKTASDAEESGYFELLEVTKLVTESDDNTRRPFSLVFSGQDTRPPQQGMFELEHEQLGHIKLFLVPVGSDEKGVNYEAIFT